MQNRTDTDALKRAHPIEATASGYGVDMRPSGRALVARCPFHHDGGRPNLYVYPGSQSWYCYRCALGGDVIEFVQRMEQVDFRGAVALLNAGTPSHPVARGGPLRHTRLNRSRTQSAPRDPAERACLAAAVELYRNRLLAEPAALDYLEQRGIVRSTIDRFSVGYASGDELAGYLRWRRLPAQAAVRVGLLRRNGRDFMARRVVVPEIRSGQPIWLVGRTIAPDVEELKYLGLPGAKPLLGWEDASRHPTVWLTEGVFDWLTLRQWGFSSVGLAGTHVSPAALQALTRFERVYLVLDSDEAGRAATADFTANLGSRAVPVGVPGVKDVAELAPLADGRARFLRAIDHCDQRLAA